MFLLDKNPGGVAAILRQHAGHDAACVFAVMDVDELQPSARQKRREAHLGALGQFAFAGASAVNLRRVDAVEAYPRFDIVIGPDAGQHLDRVAVEHTHELGADRAGDHAARVRRGGAHQTRQRHCACEADKNKGHSRTKENDPTMRQVLEQNKYIKGGVIACNLQPAGVI